MSKNVGAVDRWIRVIVGVALLAATVYGPRTAWGYIGLIPLITGMIGWCPLYQVLGLSTRTGQHLQT